MNFMIYVLLVISVIIIVAQYFVIKETKLALAREKADYNEVFKIAKENTEMFKTIDNLLRSAMRENSLLLRALSGFYDLDLASFRNYEIERLKAEITNLRSPIKQYDEAFKAYKEAQDSLRKEEPVVVAETKNEESNEQPTN